ncbi:MAG: folate family ECF transporter S component [Clostridiales bacterium]|nr:folate family ECF transporter S component [Clostridiales bacterium]
MTQSSSFRILSAEYWKEAAKSFRDVRMLVFAALIVALRVVVKAFQIPIAANLYITFDCYICALGSVVYGPLVALLCGAVSDTLGCILFPSGPYFFPFIFVEMLSGFIFALFLWRRNLSVTKTLAAKFTVNLVCNIILTSLFMKWDYYVFYGIEKAEAYNAINLVRICKNLVMFPAEAILISLVLQAVIPALKAMGFKWLPSGMEKMKVWHYVLIGILLLISIALVAAYILWGADFIKAHNIKLL